MTIGFPTNTVIVIFVAMLGTGIGAWLILSRGLRELAIPAHSGRIWRSGAALVLITWLLARLLLAVNPPGNAVVSPAVNIAFLVLALVVGILLLLVAPVFRQAIRAVPETWVVGIHAIRVGGFMFLALADMKLLPPEFALPAGYGDITVGLLALLMVYLLATRKSYARTLVMAWNVLGLLDFVVALTTGAIYVAPFVAHVAASGISPLYLNYVFIIPTFGVPLFALLHLYSLYQMLTVRSRETRPRVEGTVQSPVLSRQQRSTHS